MSGRAITALGALCLQLIASQTAAAQTRPMNQVILKAGAYFPTGDLSDARFDPSFNGEIVYGRYLSENFALDGGFAFLHSEGGEDPALQQVLRDRDLTCPIIRVTARGVYRADRVEIFGGAGPALLFPRLEVYFQAPNTDAVDERDTVFGFQALAGVNFDVVRLWYLGLEGKYLWASEAEFAGVPININGFAATLNLGLRL